MSREYGLGIIVRFASQKDLDDFSQRIGQELNKKTKSIWHPKLVRGLNANLQYVGDSFVVEPQEAKDRQH